MSEKEPYSITTKNINVVCKSGKACPYYEHSVLEICVWRHKNFNGLEEALVCSNPKILNKVKETLIHIKELM